MPWPILQRVLLECDVTPRICPLTWVIILRISHPCPALRLSADNFLQNTFPLTKCVNVVVFTPGYLHDLKWERARVRGCGAPRSHIRQEGVSGSWRQAPARMRSLQFSLQKGTSLCQALLWPGTQIHFRTMNIMGIFFHTLYVPWLRPGSGRAFSFINLPIHSLAML